MQIQARYDTGQEPDCRSPAPVSAREADPGSRRHISSHNGPFVAPGFVDIRSTADGQEFSSLALTPPKVADIMRRHYEFGVTAMRRRYHGQPRIPEHGLRAIAAACEEARNRPPNSGIIWKACSCRRRSGRARTGGRLPAARLGTILPIARGSVGGFAS